MTFEQPKNNSQETDSGNPSEKSKEELLENIEEAAKIAIEETHSEILGDKKETMIKIVKEAFLTVIDKLDKLTGVDHLNTASEDSLKDFTKGLLKDTFFILSITGIAAAGAFGIGPAEEGPGRERIKKLIDRVKSW